MLPDSEITLNCSDYFVISFHKNMSSVTRANQMDCLVRYWDNVSMDGPNVTNKFTEILTESRKEARLFQLTDTATCQPPGPILESKGMGVLFQQKGKEMLEKGKIFEHFAENVLNLKIF